MDMHKKDEQLLRSFCDERGLKDVTYVKIASPPEIFCPSKAPIVLGPPL